MPLGDAERGRLVRRRLTMLTVLTVLLLPASMLWIDVPLAHEFRSLEGAALTVVRAVGSLGNSAWYLIPSGIVSVVALAVLRWGGNRLDRNRWRRWARMGGYVFATVAATGIAVNAVKFLVGRGRPRVLFRDGWVGFQPLDGSSDFLSFPSGHATTAGAVAAALWVLWPRHGRLLLLCALLVGVARAALNAHFLSDIVAGLYLGGVGAIVVAWLFLRFGYDPRRASAFESSR